MDTTGTGDNASDTSASNAGAIIRKKTRVVLKTSQGSIFVRPSNGSSCFKWDDCEEVVACILKSQADCDGHEHFSFKTWQTSGGKKSWQVSLHLSQWGWLQVAFSSSLHGQ